VATTPAKRACSVCGTLLADDVRTPPFAPCNRLSRRKPVPFRLALLSFVLSISRFFQRILRVNRPIFGLPTVWAPSPAFDVVRQRPIQGGPVPSRFARRKQF
jgi:hypothetical protein